MSGSITGNINQIYMWYEECLNKMCRVEVGSLFACVRGFTVWPVDGDKAAGLRLTWKKKLTDEDT